MSMKFDKFVDDVLRIENEFIEDTLELQKKVALDAHSMLVIHSPIDSGRYMASHQFEFDKRGSGVAPDGLEESQYQTAIEGEEKSIKQQTFKFKNYSFFIANNLIYSESIESGHSKYQAPNGVYGVVKMKLDVQARVEAYKLNQKRYK